MDDFDIGPWDEAAKVATRKTIGMCLTILAVVVIGLFLALMVGCGEIHVNSRGDAEGCRKDYFNKRAHEAFKNGQRARLSGVPPTANPEEKACFRNAWLNGWMDAGEEPKK